MRFLAGVLNLIFYSLFKEVFMAGDDPDALQLYLDGLAPSGRRSVCSVLRQAVALLDADASVTDFPWQSLNWAQVMTVRNGLRQQGKSANTINLTLSALKGIAKSYFHCQQLAAQDWLAINQINSVRVSASSRRRSLTGQDIKRLLRYSHHQARLSLMGLRDYTLILLLLNTGLRRAELAALNTTDVDRSLQWMTVQSGKGGVARHVYLTPDCRRVLRRWLKARNTQPGPVFTPIMANRQCLNRALSGQSIYNLIQSRCLQAGIGLVRPHDLRRTFVTQLLEAGVDLNTTRQLAGHQDVQTTARYDLRDERTGQRAVRKLRYAR
jgi:integrase/recombinase XerD